MSTPRQRVYRCGDQTLVVSIETASSHHDLRITEGERECTMTLRPLDPVTYDIEVEGRRYSGYVVRHGRDIWAHFDGRAWLLEEAQPGRAGSAHHGPTDHRVLAPMTGTVRAVHVSLAQQVTAGQPLVVLEAMKMEHVLRAPRDGVIEFIGCQTGEQVEAQVLLVALTDEPAAGAESTTRKETSSQDASPDGIGESPS